MTHEEIYRQNLGSDGNWFDGAYKDKKFRHTGIFSPDNIYYIQMQHASNKQDIDALYELAVKEEARLSQLADDRDYSEGIRDEQREYDSPIQRVARDRAAGINSDLIGGSAGSSGSSGSSGAISNSVPTSQPAQGQTKFSNKYDNINSFSNALSSVGNFVSSAIGGFGTIVSGISQLKLLPSQLKLSETGARVASETADNVISQSKLDTALKAQAVASNGFQQIKDLSSFFNSDTSDEDIISTLGALGVPAEDHQNKLYGIRQYQSNPAWTAYEETQKNEANKQKAFGQTYTPAYLSVMYGLESKRYNNQLLLDIKAQNFESLFNEYLMTQENAELFAKRDVLGAQTDISDSYTQMSSNRVTQRNNQKLMQELDLSINALTEHIGIIQSETKRVDKLISDIIKQGNGNLTPENQALLDAHRHYKWTLLTTGQENMNILHDARARFDRQSYLYNVSTNEVGRFSISPFKKYQQMYGDKFFLELTTSANDGITEGAIDKGSAVLGSLVTKVFTKIP